MRWISAWLALPVALLLSCTTASFSQSRKVNTLNLMWFDFTEMVNFNPKWSWMAEMSERFFVSPTAQSQLVFRTYGFFNTRENWTIGQGFSTFLNKSAIGTIREFRSEQQFEYNQNPATRDRLRIVHRYRSEQRFTLSSSESEIGEGYSFKMRFRYRLNFDILLAKLGERNSLLKLRINNEIFLNAGKQVVYNVFDQNRLYAALVLPLMNRLTVAIAYMNTYMQKSAGDKYDLIHTYRISFQHQLSANRRQISNEENKL